MHTVGRCSDHRESAGTAAVIPGSEYSITSLYMNPPPNTGIILSGSIWPGMHPKRSSKGQDYSAIRR